jgi:hypothetical protein
MNDNYLWDKTGEADDEVQELEALLGTLKYEPQPLQVPPAMRTQRQRPFIPLAIAAAIAVLLIGAGLWVRFSNSKPAENQQAKQEPRTTAPAREILQPEPVAVAPPEQPRAPSVSTQRRNRPLVVQTIKRPIQTAAPQLTEEELAQKEQLLLALRLVSVKLNLAQRKTQGLPQANFIRNQHKVG